MATTDKYDRQLRLWGANGQKALGETCVVLLRATAAGTETLKNLVLPGVGAFCVVDDVAAPATTSVNNNDYASNFFLTRQALQDKPRAQVAMESLQELNPDVQGSFQHVESLFAFLQNELLSFMNHSSKKLLFIASDLEPHLLVEIGRFCAMHAQSLIVVQSYGLIGAVRLQTPPLALLDPKPRHAPPDLRLTALDNFVALRDMAASIDLGALEKHEHGHVPYPLILCHAGATWKAEHEGRLPQTLTEKQEFGAAIKAMARDYDQELNFQEAVRNAYLAYTPRTLDREHLTGLVAVAQTSCPDLYVMLKALEQFLAANNNNNNNNQWPPLQGTLPDMTASTDIYVRLQNVYRDRAERDLAQMRTLVDQIIITSQDDDVKVEVTDARLTSFCQNVFNLDIYTTRSIQEEYIDTNNVSDEMKEDLMMEIMEGVDEDDDNSQPEMLPLLWYLGLRACLDFFQQHGRYPGVVVESAQSADYTADHAPLQACLQALVQRYGLQDHDLIRRVLLPDQEVSKVVQEMVRYANAEVHNIATVVGGVASQEAVKIVTGQYVPLRQPVYVYNGIASTGGVYKL